MATLGDQERTERATPKRLREAREKGQIARSRDLNSLILLMTSASGVLLLGDSMIGGLVRQMQAGLSLKRAQLFDPAVLQTFTGEALIEAGRLVVDAGARTVERDGHPIAPEATGSVDHFRTAIAGFQNGQCRSSPFQ